MRAVRAPSRLRPGEIVMVVGGSALLAGSWVLVAVESAVPHWEVRVFEAVNDLHDALWPVLWAPMQLGSLLGSLGVVAISYGVTRDRALTAAALVASQAAWWSGKVVKAFVARGRPAALLRDVQIRERATGLGYVSGHAAVAFSLAAVLAPSLPRRWRAVAFGTATLVAVARVYAGAHLPLDIVGGVGLGILAGTFARWTFGLGGEGLPAR